MKSLRNKITETLARQNSMHRYHKQMTDSYVSTNSSHDGKLIALAKHFGLPVDGVDNLSLYIALSEYCISNGLDMDMDCGRYRKTRHNYEVLADVLMNYVRRYS